MGSLSTMLRVSLLEGGDITSDVLSVSPATRNWSTLSRSLKITGRRKKDIAGSRIKIARRIKAPRDGIRINQARGSYSSTVRRRA